MVGYEPNKVDLSAREKVFVSFASSAITRFFIQPFDVVKIRFQVFFLII